MARSPSNTFNNSTVRERERTGYMERERDGLKHNKGGDIIEEETERRTDGVSERQTE